MRAMPFDADYGPYCWHPLDPRAPEPPDWDEMTRAEREAELAGQFGIDELISMYLDESDRCDRLLARLAAAGIANGEG
jgi:hypothetical protein